MITKEFSIAVKEINEILSYLPKEYLEKLPTKLIAFFKDIEDKDYISKVDPYKNINEQDITEKAKILLTVLYREYWCTEDERNELDKILSENDKKYEEELRIKFNPDNLFKERRKEEVIEDFENKLITYKKKNWYQKIMEHLNNIFKRK